MTPNDRRNSGLVSHSDEGIEHGPGHGLVSSASRVVVAINRACTRHIFLGYIEYSNAFRL